MINLWGIYASNVPGWLYCDMPNGNLWTRYAFDALAWANKGSAEAVMLRTKNKDQAGLVLELRQLVPEVGVRFYNYREGVALNSIGIATHDVGLLEQRYRAGIANNIDMRMQGVIISLTN